MKNHTNPIEQLQYIKSRSGKVLLFVILTAAGSFCSIYLTLQALEKNPQNLPAT